MSKVIQFDTDTGAYLRGPLECPSRIQWDANGKHNEISSFDRLPASEQAKHGYLSDLQYVDLPAGAVLRDVVWTRDGDTAIQSGTIVTAEELEAERLAAYEGSDQQMIDQCALQYAAICTSECPQGLGSDHVLLGPEAIAVGRQKVEAGLLSEWEANCIGHELSMYSAVITNLGSNLRAALSNLE